MEDKIKQLLKESLTIEIESHYETFCGTGFKVTLLLEGEPISSDYVVTQDY